MRPRSITVEGNYIFLQNFVFFCAESLRYLARAVLPALKMHNKPNKNTLPAITTFSLI